ncbi:MAG: VPLPA-CTERM sorting domain-containing protein [Pseudomonadota bacterium]
MFLRLLPIALASFLSFSSAQADPVNFVDGNFNLIATGGPGAEARIFSETVGGSILTLEATLNLVGAERFLNMVLGNPNNGLHLGGGGGSTLEFTVTPSTDVILNSYSTVSSGFFLGTPTLDITGPGVSSLGNSLAGGNPSNALTGGPLSLEAGETYLFDVQGTGASVQTFISEFDITPVPLPAAAWMLAGAMLSLVAVRRRRKT